MKHIADWSISGHLCFAPINARHLSRRISSQKVSTDRSRRTTIQGQPRSMKTRELQSDFYAETRSNRSGQAETTFWLVGQPSDSASASLVFRLGLISNQPPAGWPVGLGEPLVSQSAATRAFDRVPPARFPAPVAISAPSRSVVVINARTQVSDSDPDRPDPDRLVRVPAGRRAPPARDRPRSFIGPGHQRIKFCVGDEKFRAGSLPGGLRHLEPRLEPPSSIGI